MVPTEQLVPFAAGVGLERKLAEIATACAQGQELPPPIVEHFMNVNFFCFDASTDPEVVNPITAEDGAGSYLLLYTSPELRGLAERPLRELGAFRGQTISHTQVPARTVFDSLPAKGGRHAGVSINTLVPGLNARYAADKLRTAGLHKAFASAKEGVQV